MMPYRQDLEIGILIGINCTLAIKPREVIAGKGDEPYTKRTALGWVIIGMVSSNSQNNENDFDTFASSISLQTSTEPP